MRNLNKRILPLLLAALMMVCALCAAGCSKKSTVEEGEKSITVNVFLDGINVSTATFLTKQEFLLGALVESGMIETAAEPLTTVCGIAIVGGKKLAWVLTKDGAPVETAPSATPLENGDHFELTLTEQ